MKKHEYMKALRRELHRLPRGDYDRAVEYFDEYFEDAGPEKEEQAIIDLGSPKEAARQIICDFAIENGEKPVKGVKKGLNSVLVGVLAVCAAPIALPLLLAAVVVVFAFLIVVLALLFSFVVIGAALALSGPVFLVAGFSVITQSVWLFLSCIGQGLIYTGLGILITWGMLILSRHFIHGVVRLFGSMVERRRERNEKDK